MKRLIQTLFILAISIQFMHAQKAPKVKDTIPVPEGWTTDGKINLLINQSAFSNWQPGGDNNFATNLSLNYDLNYHKGPWSWDTKLLASYGLNVTEDDGRRKTDDRLELNSVVGRAMNKKYWSFSFFMNFKTQFSDGYDYNDDFMGDNENYTTSGFFKPAYWSFGPGFLWKKSNNLNVNIAPLTSRFTFISDEIFTINDDDSANVFYESSNDYETFGVPPGENLLYEFGLNVRAYYKFNIMENVSMENILNLYSSYLHKPLNTDIDYTMNIVMQINDVLSTNLTFQTVYDDDAFQGFQVREVFGLGVNVTF
ncbi:DUF3078 domain-containing protein [Tamlana sp. 2_MG-2023]|uniref:DUF3078 domain-containing protein n=1 Tax=unclassified Tamlana TaxID=2614803 RepID=UPI0026E2C13D|nr:MULTISPECIES: DUF3078 domain-containing protein [unclassified Tamlana]MDO6760534.1 DUF3078 domain-containing protein [Tamlana sp. 2_MG-2023]MDO6790790.1 DUF3078 domain-containing protein [Tamlana sp. 1_MG-2023]